MQRAFLFTGQGSQFVGMGKEPAYKVIAAMMLGFALAAGERLVAGQSADLHFTTMDRSRTPVLTGEVLTVSADKLDDARSGQPYLRVRVAVPEPERARLRAAGVELRAGLPVDVMVRLGERSLLGYLLSDDHLGLRRSLGYQVALQHSVEIELEEGGQ